MEESISNKNKLDMIVWSIKQGNDGLQKDAILVAIMDKNEMLSVSLHAVCLAKE